MTTLILIGFLGGLITAISPCILPVLPVIFFTGGSKVSDSGKRVSEHSAKASEGGTTALSGGSTAVLDPVVEKESRDYRPFKVVAGLVLSFSFFTLAGATLISALGLPENVLRYTGLTLLVLIGLSLIFPWIEEQLARPFSWIPQRKVNPDGNAFTLGLGLGLLYVPCAGPVLAAITVAGARGEVSLDIVVLTVAFALGTAVPLLAFAFAGQQVAAKVKAFRARAHLVRVIGGIMMILLAFALAFNLTTALQAALPNYTGGIQKAVEDNSAARQKLSGLYDNSNIELSKCEDGVNELRSCGQAPPIEGIDAWFNTAGNTPVELSSLRGKVVLVDFWTYSCINCQRSLPYIKAWDETYKDSGLQIIGVHSPEFAFEKNPDNVSSQAKQLGVTYPVALDNDLTTWDNYRNRFWPAKYLIDSNGVVRYFTFGEGRYAQTENLIRTLLTDAQPGIKLPKATSVEAENLAKDRTPETYLNTARLAPDRYVGDAPERDVAHTFPLPKNIPDNAIGLGGTWTPGYEYFTAGPDARIALNYQAQKVYLVLA
ncbi:MAG: redoxin domain-containing protein, partial [Longispora sp.]|nr:redoxin domain-containing protein [Longispora sp. (in: high G+C Gram-positive bacteria)]